MSSSLNRFRRKSAGRMVRRTQLDKHFDRGPMIIPVLLDGAYAGIQAGMTCLKRYGYHVKNSMIAI